MVKSARRTIPGALMAGGAVLVLTACGGSSPGPEAVARAYVRDVGEGHGQAACNQLTAAQVKDTPVAAHKPGDSCATAIIAGRGAITKTQLAGFLNPKIKSTTTAGSGLTATVQFAIGGAYMLTKQGGRWFISGFGS